MKLLRRHPLPIALIVVLVVGLLVAVISLQNRTQTKTNVQATTTLYFSQTSSQSLPIKTIIAVPATLGVTVNPGTNYVSFIKLELQYDATYFDSTSVTFARNEQAFPLLVEGPVFLLGKVLVSLSTGTDYTKAVKTSTLVGNLRLTPLVKTPKKSTTVVSFGNLTQALSVAPSDSSGDNVLSQTIPAYFTISDSTRGRPRK